MSLRQIVIPVVMMLSCAVAIGLLIQRQLEATWFGFGAYERVIDALEQSLDDQKALAGLEPEQATEYRLRFEETRKTLNGLRVLELNRGRLLGRARFALLALLGAVVLAGTVSFVVTSRRDQRRLGRLRLALERLSSGEDVGRLSVRGADSIGRVAEMVEEMSRLVGGQRRRLEDARRLTAWQEAARRQVHEIRGPVTSAQLQLRRLASSVAGSEDAAITETISGLEAELEVLATWTRSSAKFGRLQLPKPEHVDLVQEVRQFVESFAEAWPGLTLVVHGESAVKAPACVDRLMLRQVLVNLAENSAQAVQSHGGTLTFWVGREAGTVVVEAVDDGPGIDAKVAARVFDPHVTTRPLGKGSGLGLAISRKIALDHGGDLEVVDSDRGPLSACAYRQRSRFRKQNKVHGAERRGVYELCTDCGGPPQGSGGAASADGARGSRGLGGGFDGGGARRARRAGAAWPDLLLVDVRLPGASGLELVRSLANERRLPPTVVVSGEASLSEAVEAVQQDGVYDFIEKPFSPERLGAVGSQRARASAAAESDRLCDAASTVTV